MFHRLKKLIAGTDAGLGHAGGAVDKSVSAGKVPPRDLAERLAELVWDKPWHNLCVPEEKSRQFLESELKKELGERHILYPFAQTAVAVARRQDCDDVLFWVPATDFEFAVVHLTYSNRPETNPVWPMTGTYKSLSDFVESEFLPTQLEWANR